ncbi:DUF4293 domain-containing protein [Flavobacteriaceae bacterium]|nr:DUF4293 domain-containing protein [Flavobacteriaceae bacterium]MDB4153435.1 DUF4293 domain-containing protein [Flavobacteriaceae bacterium]|tara:strand:+ start:2255 stop:2650 length:396 start_codon:yes stop_codon:yes gene_type:complete
MLQRIQTLYTLVFIAITILVIVRFPIPLDDNPERIYVVLSNMPYLFVLLASVSLMLFSKRSFQLVLNRLILVTSIGYEVFELVDVFEQFDSLKQLILIHYSLVLLSWIFLLLVNKYIKKDEALIRSVDRLR